jgi:hypothetical protein
MLGDLGHKMLMQHEKQTIVARFSVECKKQSTMVLLMAAFKKIPEIPELKYTRMILHPSQSVPPASVWNNIGSKYHRKGE